MRRSLRAGQRAVVGKAILVLVATLAAVAQSQTSCTAHTQCPNDAGSTRANYCDTRNLCYSCSWGYTPAGGSLSGFSCSFANSFGLVDAVVSFESFKPPTLDTGQTDHQFSYGMHPELWAASCSGLVLSGVAWGC